MISWATKQPEMNRKEILNTTLFQFPKFNIFVELQRKNNLRIPPLYAKNGGNRSFSYSGNISVHEWHRQSNFLWSIDLYLDSVFLSNLIMIHVRDVINTPINEGNHKTFAKSLCQSVQKKFILIIILVFLCEKAGVTCIHSQTYLSEGQEIDRRSKLPREV